MKKVLLGATICLSMLATVSKAQNIQPCGMHQAMDYFKKNLPGYKEQLEAQEMAENQLMSASKTSTFAITDTITIPVVFHVLHQNGSENIADNILINALQFVNNDYARMHSDTATIDTLFAPLYKNSLLRFALAKKDPQGNCTNGIVRHYDENTNWAQANLFAYQYSTIESGNWNPSKYLNIYIVTQIIDESGSTGGTIIGYTYKPGTAPVSSADAIVYRHDALSNQYETRSLSHEIGHWLGLSHTFGNTNNPGVDCGDDGIADTPPTKGYFSTCPNVTNDTLCDVINHLRPNKENIMDYSACPKMFTADQIDVMRTAARAGTAYRSVVTSSNNLVYTTGVCSQVADVVNGGFYYPLLPAPNCAPIADFASNKLMACNNQSVTYTSTSYNGTITSYSWVFEGGTPATSTNASEVVTYSTPGAHSVSLVVTNSIGSSSISKSNAIWVGWNSDSTYFTSTTSYTEGFENGIPAGMWYSQNYDAGTPAFKITNYGSNNSSKSVVLESYNYYTPGQEDVLESSQFNFEKVTNVSFNFDYSYARRTTTTDEDFRVQFSTDCGGTWTNMPGSPSAAVLATSGGTLNSGGYIPFTAAKWVTKSIPSAILGQLSNKRDVKFRFYFRNASSGQANNLYIDNINISGIVGLEDLARTIDLSIYPNPTNASSTIEFTSPVSSKVEVTVNDVTGRLVEISNFTTDAGITSKYQVNKSQALNSGIYFVTLSLDGQKVTKKLIIE